MSTQLCSPRQRRVSERVKLRASIPRFLALAFIGLTVVPHPASANKDHGARALIVSNDRGGLLNRRLRQIQSLRASGRPVRIIGQVCYSTCTMLLGLPQTCISPETVFGFHGPSAYGRALEPKRFDWASRVISHYYPPRLQKWYLETGRYRISRVYRIRGRDLIAMGVPSC